MSSSHENRNMSVENKKSKHFASKKEGRDRESIQSSTTTGQGHHMGK